MSTADPPGSVPSPSRGSTSQEESRGSEHEEIQDLITKEGSMNDGGKESLESGVENTGLNQDLKDQDKATRGSKGSWIGVVQGQKILRKYEVEVTMKDGIGSVLVPDEITKDVPPLWDDFLVGKFLDTAPHIAKIHSIVSKIWTLNDKAQKIEVFEVNETTMKFRVPNQADRRRILRRGMWNLAGVPVVMTKWSPVIEKEKPPTQSIPMWVHVKNVPMKMFSWQGLSFLTSPIGIPGRLHPETAQCLNLDVAKIFVRVDLTKDLPKKMNFNIQGEDVMVEYGYPWLPTKCPKCEKWGHAIKACPKGKEIQEQKQEEVTEGVEKESDGNTEDQRLKMKTIDVSVVEVTLPVESDEIVNKEGGDMGSGGKTFQEEDESTQGKEWLNVSPGKSSRSSPKSQKGLEFGQVSILTKSRFAVLLPMEEQEVINTGNEEQIEEEGHEVIHEEEVIHRRMLPRESKVNHRYLRDKTSQKTQEADPSYLNKKKPRRQ
ncbi:hypothetical protein Bca101_028491 [Brassica carinata]